MRRFFITTTVVCSLFTLFLAGCIAPRLETAGTGTKLSAAPPKISEKAPKSEAEDPEEDEGIVLFDKNGLKIGAAFLLEMEAGASRVAYRPKQFAPAPKRDGRASSANSRPAGATSHWASSCTSMRRLRLRLFTTSTTRTRRS